jgi:hypothetical protein
VHTNIYSYSKLETNVKMWLDKQTVVLLHKENYSAIKRNSLVIHAKTWSIYTTFFWVKETSLKSWCTIDPIYMTSWRRQTIGMEMRAVSAKSYGWGSITLKWWHAGEMTLLCILWYYIEFIKLFTKTKSIMLIFLNKNFLNISKIWIWLIIGMAFKNIKEADTEG